MNPLAYLDFFARIRKRLGILGDHVLKPDLRRCAVCGKRVRSLRAAEARGETDSRQLCRSCFELLLDAATRKSIAVREPEPGSLTDSNEHLA